VKTLLAGAIVAAFLGTALQAGAASQRYVPFTLVGGDLQTILMGQAHPPHRHLALVFTKAGSQKLLGLTTPEDQERARAVDFRRFVLVGVFLDYDFASYCPKSVSMRRLRIHDGRVDASVTVELRSSCAGSPEIAAAHLYSLAQFPRRFTPKRARAGNVDIRFVRVP
jgi:hypothetical protein